MSWRTVVTAVREDHYSVLKELQRMNAVFLQNLSDAIPFPITFDQEISIQELLKTADVRFNFEDQNLSEILIDYLSVMREYCGKSVFFICNLKTWLERSELLNFCKDVIYRKINIILLENRAGDMLPEYEICRIIDTDLCEIN